jgi:hypothetical protein
MSLSGTSLLAALYESVRDNEPQVSHAQLHAQQGAPTAHHHHSSHSHSHGHHHHQHHEHHDDGIQPRYQQYHEDKHNRVRIL